MIGSAGLAAYVLAVIASSAVGGETHVADVYSAGDVAHWLIEQGGTKIGETWSTYVGVVDTGGTGGAKAHRFVSGAILTGPSPVGAIEVKRTGDLLTDDLGRPLHFVLRTTVGQVVAEVDAAFSGGKAKLHVISGSVVSDSEVAVPADTFLLANNMVAQLELFAALHPPKEGAPIQTQAFSPEPSVLRCVPFELQHAGTFTAKWNDEEIEGEKYRDSLGEELQVAADGKLIALEIAAASLRFRRVSEPPPKLEIAAPKLMPADFEAESVVIENGPVRIAGTVTKKRAGNKDPARARRPAIFFVSGSGAQDRDGTSAGIDLGTHEILDRLTERGFLVLRVDDRGAGATTGPADDVSFDDLISDARVCVDFLMKRADVDPKRVAVIGHSEGGETAPILACERPLAAIVLMAAPGRSLNAIMREQAQRALEDLHLPKATVDAELEVHDKFIAVVSSDGPVDAKDVRADYAPYLKQRKWFQSHAHHDAIAQIKQVKCPILIAQGGNDLQVSPELDARALETALIGVKHPDATLHLFRGLDHLFKRSPNATPSLADYLQPRPVDPEFLDALCVWLEARLKP